MENRAAMWALIMKAFFEGFADFMRSFWRSAAAHGLTVMLLMVVNVGLVVWIDRIITSNTQYKLDCQRQMADIRNEYRGDINRMDAKMDTIRRGLDDCNEARIRVESQNAVLLRLLKKN
jgi:nitrate/TMAO reductase-like tetraheme cytochrome c subunit